LPSCENRSMSMRRGSDELIGKSGAYALRADPRVDPFSLTLARRSRGDAAGCDAERSSIVAHPLCPGLFRHARHSRGFRFYVRARSMPEPFAKLTTVTRIIGHASAGRQPFPEITVNRRIAEVLPWRTPFWILGVILFHLRGIAGCTSARRLRRKGVCSARVGSNGSINLAHACT
jgi:hypothetical protein